MRKLNFIHINLITSLIVFQGAVACFGQSAEAGLESGMGSEWRLVNLARAASKSKESVPPQAAIAGGGEARTASAIAAPSFQLEGFPGISDDNTKTFPDPAGAVSGEYVLTATSVGIRVQDRKGKELKFVTLESFFSGAGPFRTIIFAPRAAFDVNAKRFILAAIADPFTSSAGLVVAVSKSSDPRGDWKMSRISTPYSGTLFTTLNLAVAGKTLAISADVSDGAGYYATENYLFYLPNVYPDNAGLAYQKFEDFLEVNAPASDPNPDATRILFVNNSYFLNTGNYAMVFKEVKVAPGGSSFIIGLRTSTDAGDIYKYTPGEILPQAGTDKKLDAARSLIQNCAARNTSVWCVNTMFVRFGAELRSVIQYTRMNWPENGSAITLTERVRVDDTTGASYFGFPSIAANKNGDIFIGYNRFRKDQYVGAYFAFRKSADTAGGLYYDGLIKEGEDSFERGSVASIWGSYSTTVTDPLDDTSFWTLQSHAGSKTEGGTTTWGTWWTRFSLHNGACSYKVDQGAFDVPVTGGAFKVSLTPNFADCAWMVAPNAGWLSQTNSVNTTGTATLEFAATANRRGQARTGTIRVGDQLITVRQPANPAPPVAEPTLSVLRFTAPATARVGEAFTVNVVVRNNGTKTAAKFRVGFYLGTGPSVTTKDLDTGLGCVVTDGLAIDSTTTCTSTLTFDAALTPGTYTLAAIADDTAVLPTTDRSAASRVSDAGSFVLKASATAPAVTSAAVVNGATALAGPVAPGAIVVIYGARLGPAALTTLTLNAQGRVSTLLEGTRILFDGVAAPMIYTSAGQVSAIVPYSVAGKTTTSVTFEYNGLRSDPVALPVLPSAPGFFSVDFSGKNQVAALNEDGSVNSAGNPIGVGKLIVLYGTGAGNFKMPGVDGAVIGAPLPEFAAPLSLKIGGVDAELLYAGPAPGLVSGVFQINARVPDGVGPGDKVAITMKSGSIESPLGTTIAVK